MSKGFADITGDAELAKLFAKLDDKVQKRLESKTLRASAKRLRRHISDSVPVNEGNLKAAMRRAKVRKVRARRRSVVRLGVLMPTRADLGIPDDAKGYYPFALEYGFRTRDGRHVPPRRFIRGTVDKSGPNEVRLIAHDLGRFIESEARASAQRGRR